MHMRGRCAILTLVHKFRNRSCSTCVSGSFATFFLVWFFADISSRKGDEMIFYIKNFFACICILCLGPFHSSKFAIKTKTGKDDVHCGVCAL